MPIKLSEREYYDNEEKRNHRIRAIIKPVKQIKKDKMPRQSPHNQNIQEVDAVQVLNAFSKSICKFEGEQKCCTS